jgi:hypothetical protein
MVGNSASWKIDGFSNFVNYPLVVANENSLVTPVTTAVPLRPAEIATDGSFVLFTIPAGCPMS